MPQAGIAIANWAISGLVGAGLSAASAQAFLMTLAYATDAFLLNKALGALAKRGNTGETRGLEVSITDATADSRVIYGEIRCGGVNIIPPYTSGSNGEYLHQVLAVAMCEIDSFQEFYFDQATLPAPAAVTGVAGDGLISTGTYANAAWVRGYTGSMTQTVDYILNTAFPTQWPTTSCGRGTAYVAFKYDYGKGKVFQGPPQATFKVRGAKVYDPRLDTTNGGSGSHRYATPSTWAYSNNPALCWANYRIAGYGFALDPATEIDWPSVAAAADICDALVANKDGSTSKRYTCNGLLINSTDALADNDQKLIDSMFGREIFVNGKWHCFAGAWNSASYSIEKADWLSIDSIQTVSGRDAGRFNEVRCFYVDPNRNWQRVESWPRRNATFKSDDAGELIGIEMEQPMCTDESEAQRKAEFMLRTSRNGIKLVGALPPRFMKIRTYETVALNFAELGWVSKTFRVSAMTLNTDGSVKVALTEEQDTDWTDLVLADYNNPSTSSIPAANPTTPSAPSSFRLITNAGTIIASIGEPVIIPRDTEYVIYRASAGDAAVTSREQVWRGRASQTYLQAVTNSMYYYWARAEVSSLASGYTPESYGLQATPEGLNTGIPCLRNADFTAGSLSPSWQTGSASVVSFVTDSGGMRGGLVRINAVDSYNFPSSYDLFYLRQLSHVKLTDTRTLGLRVEVVYRVNSQYGGGSFREFNLDCGVTDLAGAFALTLTGGAGSLISTGGPGVGNIGKTVKDGYIQSSGTLAYPYLRIGGYNASSGQVDILHAQVYVT